MTTKPIMREEPFLLQHSETGMASRDVAPDFNLDQWQDLWRFQVPVSHAYIFTPGHQFSLYAQYLADTVDLALSNDGGVFTDETTDANDAGADDVTLLPATEATDDAFYVGHRHPFGQIYIDMTQVGVGTGIKFEYYNGSAWAAIPGLTDGTTELTVDGAISFWPPGDWARTTVDGKDAYWIRLVCDDASYTTQPLGDRVYINGISGVEVHNRETFRVEIRDASENQRIPILHMLQYRQIKEFTDRSKKMSLPIHVPVVAQERYWIVIQAKPQAGIIDVSESYFQLQTLRVRKGLYT